MRVMPSNAKRFVCEDCNHTWTLSAFEKEFGAHCPRCKSARIKETQADMNQ